MYLCSENHEEICHESRNCPLCEKIEDLEKANDEISKLNKELSEME